MDLNLRTPPALRGSEKDQIEQLRSYLIQMQRSLEVALDGIDSRAIAMEAAKAVQQGGDPLPDGGQPTVHEAYRQLKALIIKTADTVQHEYDELVRTLESDYLAKSQFGEFQETLGQTITETASSVVQSFQYDSKLQALTDNLNTFNESLGSVNTLLDGIGTELSQLDTYNINSQQYIKSGLLYFDDNNVPRYGVAIGEKLTTITVNGQEVIRRTNLVGTFTSDRLSFWQNDVEVAYVSNNQLYITEARVLSSLFLGNWVIDTSYGFAIKWAEG